ncbi:DUF5017 domain-containing protein [Pedobacter chinensis]|uniref:DUF5017 domain-containing protein n=1 Tax=Pedobacter chinensis TaxID=2282421 RepID=A0A369PTG6_9SPHI|nr:DUF5017 domain-containing protein [Pedobacter chinensis]RDC54535.1 DUF5017 domain-containing protein [Pedobacter chinensis]
MKYSFYTILIASTCFLACKKDLTTDLPTVDIALTNARSTIGDTLVFKLGDTCKFALSGYADNIVFWSGTPGNKYEFKSRSSAFGKPTLSFTSTAQWGTQNNTLQVLATNKLPAKDSASVVNAAWTNITSRTPLAISATAVNTGIVNLSDLVTGASDSLFIAFKYDGVTGSTQRTWTITDYFVNNVLSDYTYSLSSLASDNAFWTRYGNVWSPASSRWVATTTALTIVGGAATAPTNTSWIISKPLYVGRVAPDVPTATVKNITASALTAYSYKYAAVGKYKITFASYNTTPDDNQVVLKEFNVKVIL